MNKKIPFFNYPELFNRHEESLIQVFKDVGKRGAFIMQKDLEEFEQNLAKYTGANYAVGVANATDGLQMGMMAGGLKAGGEVIISSHTMIATASAIHYAGCTPVPVESSMNLMIDPVSIEKAINERTVAIMPTHLNGRTCNMDEINDIAKKYSLSIYEDAAQALGSKYKGKCAGTFGVASAISLYPAKILGTLGDGGAVLTNDKEVYENLLLLRDHGRDPLTGEVVSWGFNSRLDNLQAAFLNYFMKDYENIIKRRRFLANLYDEALSSLEEIDIPICPQNGDHFDVFQNYEIKASRRDELKKYLADKGIGTLIQWGGKAIHHFKSLKFNQKLPRTDKIFSELLMLPLNMFLSDDDVKHIAEEIKKFYKKS